MVSLSPHVLLAGVSTRAAAESAARAGFVVTAIDAFGDLDQHPSVHALSLPRSFTTHAAARRARRIECDAVAYLSSFENHPAAVRLLAAGRALWGNAPHVLRRVREPLLLARTLRERGLAAPAVRISLAGDATDPDNAERQWLVKPLASGGGHGVRPWRSERAGRGTARLPRGCYLQERVDGAPGSVVFVAAGGRAVPIGMTCQLVGEPDFGSAGYRYCGNILVAAGDPVFARDEWLVEAASALARAVAEAFGVVGVNGIDFIAREGVPYTLEVNPRWSASMELVEHAYGLSVFGAHAAACISGALPDFDLVRTRRGTAAIGKAVVFARRDIVVGDTRAWLPGGDVVRASVAGSVRDIPHPGDRIPAGRPVCTVFADGPDAAACRAALVRQAERVYAEIDVWERGDLEPGLTRVL